MEPVARSTGRFSMIIVCILYVLQQIILLQGLIGDFSRGIYYSIAAADILFGLYLLWSLRCTGRRVAYKCAVQWLLYSILLAIKLFIASMQPLRAVSAGASHSLISENTLISLGMLLTPLLFAVLFKRAVTSTAYYTQKNELPAEELLQCDIGLTMTVDLIDIMAIFDLSHQSYLRANAGTISAEYEFERWIPLLMTINAIVSVVLLGCAFPVGADSMAESSNNKSLEIFACAKHVYIVGIFFIDLPFAIIRLYLLIENFHYDIFIAKNFLVLLLRPFRLYQCKVAKLENAKARKTINPGFGGSSFSSKPQELKNRHMDPIMSNRKLHTPQGHIVDVARSTSSSVGSHSLSSIDASADAGVFTNKIKMFKKKKEYGAGGSFYGMQPSISGSSVGKHMAVLNDASRASRQTAYFDTNEFNSQQVSPDSNELYLQRHENKVLHEAKAVNFYSKYSALWHVRGVPVKGAGTLKLAKKLLQILFSGGGGTYVGCFQSKLEASCGQRIALIVVFLTACVTRIGISVMPIFKPTGLGLFLIGEDTFSLWEYIFNAEYWSMIITGASTIILLLIFLTSSPFFDTIYVIIGWVIRCLSFMLISRRFLRCLLIVQEGSDSFMPYYIAASSCLLSAISLIFYVTVIINGLLGKPYLHYGRKLNQASGFAAGYRNVTANYSIDSDPAATNSALTFLACRYVYGPISYHGLLLGSDIIRDIKLSDNLNQAYWFDITRVLCLRLLVSSSGIDLYELLIYGLHILFLVSYAALSQSIRMIVLRRYEVKLCLEEAVKYRSKRTSCESQSSEESDNDSGSIGKRVKEVSFILMSDVVHYYKKEGLFSSPGNIFPHSF